MASESHSSDFTRLPEHPLYPQKVSAVETFWFRALVKKIGQFSALMLTRVLHEDPFITLPPSFAQLCLTRLSATGKE